MQRSIPEYPKETSGECLRNICERFWNAYFRLLYDEERLVIDLKLKKLNAGLGLLSILFLIVHMGYSIFSYITFYYNPVLKLVTAIPFMVTLCLHAVCGMLTVFMQKDGSRMDLYPRQNLSTILQRVSAALIFPLLILHINTFSLMKASAEKGYTIFILLLILAELVFFAVVIIHVAVSLTRGFISLGLLSSREKQRAIDRFVYLLGVLFFIIAAYSVVKGQIAMFPMG